MQTICTIFHSPTLQHSASITHVRGAPKSSKTSLFPMMGKVISD